MKYPIIVEALDRTCLLYWKAKNFLSRKTAKSCNQIHLVKSRTFLSIFLQGYTMLSFTISA